ncbi:histidine kinase [Halorubrum sp. JWXQ-INN 858]|uniref:histidine kinase n=1 Tax=Halorubrum sp. JWXQ-INN 858 TaxID=2690782 RepID=UPI001356B1EE|nr:histidine kinase [Halorubrum sp. JWXQ-INN 858]MWV65215.1 histidine kinase [Halorubrum sp. JWXQ-INN 858]
MTLRSFLDGVEAPERSLVLLNRSAPLPVKRLLERLFEGQPVEISESTVPDGDEDLVLLVEDGTVIESATLEAFQNDILLVNSDLFVTGARGLEEIEPLPILERLDEIPFSMRGYPMSNGEKLLLILISRYIERRAWVRGGGTLRASFQSLSRIADEIGTQQVYRRLDATDVDVHVYGAPGWDPPPNSTITAHAGYGPDFLDSWFVVYTPPEGGDGHVALLALENDPNEWDGFWTYRPSLVADVDAYIARNL